MNTIHHPSESNRIDDASTDSEQLRLDARRRRALTILFAIILATMASVASAQSGEAIYYSDSGVSTTSRGEGESASTLSGVTESLRESSGIEYFVTKPDHVSHIAGPSMGGLMPRSRHSQTQRPSHVEFIASLSNFDPDADPDGWRAEIVLRDRDDRPVVIRAYATFELTPRISTIDSRRFINATDKPIRWSMPLTSDEDGVARVKLPLRDSLKPMLGWSSASYPASGMRSGGTRSRSRPSHTRHTRRTFVTTDVRDLIGTPSSGELRVRVSVPTEGVFEAVAVVHIRPSVLVDTQWPYR